nr:hypothetical protein [Tanacetum cinerariifolium]
MGGSPYGGGYGAPEDAYLFTGAMHNVGGNSTVPSLGFDIRGSSRDSNFDISLLVIDLILELVLVMHYEFR